MSLTKEVDPIISAFRTLLLTQLSFLPWWMGGYISDPKFRLWSYNLLLVSEEITIQRMIIKYLSDIKTLTIFEATHVDNWLAFDRIKNKLPECCVKLWRKPMAQTFAQPRKHGFHFSTPSLSTYFLSLAGPRKDCWEDTPSPIRRTGLTCSFFFLSLAFSSWTRWHSDFTFSSLSLASLRAIWT